MFRSTIAALFALGLPATALAQAAPSPVAPAPSATAPAPARICQRIVPTGSIMAKKFCLTAAEWKQFTAQTNAGAEQFLARRGTGTCDIKCEP